MLRLSGLGIISESIYVCVCPFLLLGLGSSPVCVCVQHWGHWPLLAAAIGDKRVELLLLVVVRVDSSDCQHGGGWCGYHVTHVMNSRWLPFLSSSFTPYMLI